MQTTVVNYFDDETNERVVSKYYIGSDEVSFEKYVDIIEELIPDEEDDSEIDNEEIKHGEDCMCEDCLEDRKNIYLAEAVKFLFENELCPKHVFELLGDIYDKANYEGYEEGYAECKEEMREFLED